MRRFGEFVFVGILLLWVAPAADVRSELLTEVPGCREEADLVTARGSVPVGLGGGRCLAAAGHYAYVSGSLEEFVVVDFSDPDDPVEVATVATPREIAGLALSGQRLLVAMAHEALASYDLTDPARPVPDLVLPLDYAIEDLAVGGDTAFLALGNGGVMGVALEYPGFLFVRSIVNTGGNVHASAWRDDRLYLADGDYGLVVFDATDPAALQYLGSVSFPGEAKTVTAKYGRVAVGGISDRTQGTTVVLYDASGPGLPLELASRDFDGSSVYVPRPLLRTADRILLTRTGEDLAVTELVHQGVELLTHGRSRSLGSLALADTGEWLVGLSSSVSTAPSGGLAPNALAAFAAFKGNAVREGDLLYYSTGTGLGIVDVSDPFAPYEMGELPLASVLATAPIAANGTLVYLGRNGAGINVALAADPANPMDLGIVDTGGRVTALLREGDFLYAAVGGDGLQIFDVSGTGPILGGAVTPTDHEYTPVMAKLDDQLLISLPTGGARVYDVSDPGAPVHVEDFGQGPMTALAFTEDGRLLTGLSGFGGLVSYVADAQGHWGLDGQSPGTGTVRRILVEGDLAYTAEGALAVYDLSSEPYPVMKHHFEASIGAQPLLTGYAEEIMSVAVNQGILLHAKPCLQPVSAVRDEQMPSVRLLGAPWPNPFNPRTNVAFVLPLAGDVQLVVHDLRGRRLRTLWQGPAPAGTNRVTWDGTDDRGHGVAAGVYFVRLVSGAHVEHRKVALIK